MVNTAKITTVSEGQLDTELASWTLSTKTKGRLGSGTNAATAADTELQTPLANSLKSWNDVTQTTGVTTYEYLLAFTEQNGATINEASVEDASANLHARIVFSDDTITKSNTKEYYIQIEETTTTTINP